MESIAAKRHGHTPDAAEHNNADPVANEEGEDTANRRSVPPDPSHVSFVFEENLYGFTAMPDNPVRLFVLGMLLIFNFTLVFGLTWLLTTRVLDDTAERKSTLYASDDSLCRRVGDKWDCTPPVLKDLLDFDALDLNKDGLWTSPEARSSNLLHRFRAMHDIVQQSPEMLAVMFPPLPPVGDTFCVMMPATVFVENLKMFDLFELLELSNRLSSPVIVTCGASWWNDHCGVRAPNRTSLADCHEKAYQHQSERECLFKEICAEAATKSVVSSNDRYLAATSFMSVMPRSVHEGIKSNVFVICRLIDPDQCGNKHKFLGAVPTWAGLGIEEKVARCRQLLTETCPTLLGAHYDAFQVRMSSVCGSREYAVKEVTNSESVGPPAAAVSCADDEVQAKEVGLKYTTVDFPYVQYIFRGAEYMWGYPVGSILANMGCNAMANIMGFCVETTSMADPDKNQSFIAVGSLIARICPISCGSLRPLVFSLPPACALQRLGLNASTPILGGPSAPGLAPATPFAHIKSSLVELVAYGGCQALFFDHDAASGTIIVHRNSANVQDSGNGDACTIVLLPAVALRAYVVKMNLRLRLDQRSPTEDADCFLDRVEIDGRKLCNARKPSYVDIPKGNAEVIMQWLPCETCMPYVPLRSADEAQEWTIQLVDSGKVTTSFVKTVSFELHNTFWLGGSRGVMTMGFHLFLFAILTVWFSFLQKEFIGMVEYIYFLMVFPAPRRRRYLFLVFVACPRVAIWAWVTMVGIFLLAASTSSLIEIVLNSVALSFILDLDEYLFYAVVPARARTKFAEFRAQEIKLEVPVVLRPLRKLFASYHNLYLYIRGATLLTFSGLFLYILYNVEPDFNSTAHVAQCLCTLSGRRCTTNI